MSAEEDDDYYDDDNVSVHSGDHDSADLMMSSSLYDRVSVLEHKVEDLETKIAKLQSSRGGVKKTKKRKQNKKQKTKRRHNKKR